MLVVLALELKVSRTSLWLFKDKKQAFENVALYDLNQNTFIKEHAIWEKEFPRYYQHLMITDTLVSNEVDKDDHFQELMEEYLIPNNINSAMGRQIWYGGTLFGYVIVEHAGHYRNWEIIEEMHLNIAVSYIVQSYNSKQWLAKYHPERITDTDLVELIDKEKEEMRKKLTDHAFYASHNIRHPITTILALIDLIKANWEDREGYESLFKQLKVEIMNLDEIIRVMSAKIELD